MEIDPNNGWHILALAVVGGVLELGVFAWIGLAIGRSNARLAALQIELASTLTQTRN